LTFGGAFQELTLIQNLLFLAKISGEQAIIKDYLGAAPFGMETTFPDRQEKMHCQQKIQIVITKQR
jgi:hypothetical protein